MCLTDIWLVDFNTFLANMAHQDYRGIVQSCSTSGGNEWVCKLKTADGREHSLFMKTEPQDYYRLSALWGSEIEVSEGIVTDLRSGNTYAVERIFEE